MIAYILYTKDSPIESDLSRFVERLKSFQVESKLIEADSNEGITLAQNYDLLGRPAIALVRDDGSMVERWQEQLPQPEDISYLAHQ